MIKRGALTANPLIGQGFEESHDSNFVEGAEAGAYEAGINVRGGEIAAAAVEVHHLQERGLAAVEEERGGQLDIAQIGGFNGSANRNRRAGRNRSTADLSERGELGDGERGQA